jgi:hypothetical protein
MTGHGTRINKVKKNFYRFQEKLLKMFNTYYDGLVSKEDFKEVFYLYNLIMFLAEKNIDFNIAIFVIIPTSSSEIDLTRFEIEHFNGKLSIFLMSSELLPLGKLYRDPEMSLIVKICSEVDDSVVKEVSEKYELELQEDDGGIFYGGYYSKNWTKVYYTSNGKRIIFENFEPIKIFFALGK